MTKVNGYNFAHLDNNDLIKIKHIENEISKNYKDGVILLAFTKDKLENK